MQPSTLQTLLRRAGTVRFTRREDAMRTTSSLLNLSTHYAHYQDAAAVLVPPLQRLSRRHAASLTLVATELRVDATTRLDGRRLSLVCKVLPLATSSHLPAETLSTAWTHLGGALVDGLRASAWSAHDLHAVTSPFLRHGAGHVDADLVRAVQGEVFRYLSLQAPKVADAEALAVLTVMAVNLQLAGGGVDADITLAAVQQTLAQRAVDLHRLAPIRPGLLAHLCGQWNRLVLINTPLASVVEREAVGIAEDGDLFAVVQCLRFLWRHPLVTAEAALPSLLERLSSEALDAQTWSDVSHTIVDPTVLSRRAESLRAELRDIVIFLSAQLVELFAVAVDEGGLESSSPETVEAVARRLLALRRVLALTAPETSTDGASGAAALPAEFVAAVSACGSRISAAAESLMSSASPPFELMSSLADTPCDAARQCCLALIHEAALQFVHLPTAQAFQFLLVMGDTVTSARDDAAASSVDAVTVAYLADAFVKTAAAIPPIQLVAALRALADSWATGASGNTAQQAAVLRFCVEKVQASLADGSMPLHALLVAMAALHRMGCRDASLHLAVATYVGSKARLVAPTLLCRSAASVSCEALGEDLLDEHSAVHELLLEATASGLSGDATLAPSVWMHRHDPANTLLPLTAVQLRSRQLVDTMARTPAHERDALVDLATQYVAHLADAHPDEHRRFFAVFEDKVLKEDAVLRTCVHAMAQDRLLLSRLSDASLAGIVHSLAAVRFTYTRAVRELLLGVTREQWEDMSATALVDLLAGMAKLSLTTPAVQTIIGERLVALLPLLTPVQLALAIRSLQSLGGSGSSVDGRRAVLDALLRHAATNARRFDEMSLSVLFSTPSIHRLLRDPQVALPLAQQAALQLTSQPQRQRIAGSLRRSGLPRDAIASASAQLLSPHAPPSLQLGR